MTKKLKQKLRSLVIEEKRSRTRLTEAALVALLLLGPSFTVAAVSARLVRALDDTRTAATSLARAHVGRTEPIPEPSDVEARSIQLGKQAAAGALASVLIRAVQARLATVDPESPASFQSVAHQAAADAAKRIKLTSDTEFYRDYNERFVAGIRASDPTAQLIWVAILDKHTCSTCESLDGTVVSVSEGFKTLPPVHGRCRCAIHTI